MCLLREDEAPRLKLNISMKPIPIEIANTPFYIGNDPEGEIEGLETSKYLKIADAKKRIVAKISYLENKYWILETMNKLKPVIVLKKGKKVYFTSNIRLSYVNENKS